MNYTKKRYKITIFLFNKKCVAELCTLTAKSTATDVCVTKAVYFAKILHKKHRRQPTVFSMFVFSITA